MAIVLPLVGYFVYKFISSNSEASSPRRLLGAVIGSYAGINAAALCAGIELGLQPLLFHTASGTPLYAPYGLATSVPAMLGAHLLVAGPVEALVTGLVVFYLQRAHSSLLQADVQAKGEGKRWVLWGGLAAAGAGHSDRAAGLRHGLGGVGAGRAQDYGLERHTSRIAETGGLVAGSAAGLRLPQDGGGHRLYPVRLRGHGADRLSALDGRALAYT